MLLAQDMIDGKSLDGLPDDEITDDIRTKLLVEALTREDFSDELGQVLTDLQTTCKLG